MESSLTDRISPSARCTIAPDGSARSVDWKHLRRGFGHPDTDLLIDDDIGRLDNTHEPIVDRSNESFLFKRVPDKFRCRFLSLGDNDDVEPEL